MAEGESGLRSLTSKIRRRLFSRRAPGALPQSNPEDNINTEKIEAYILLGLDFIKKEQYQEAMTHFQDWKTAQSMGLQTGSAMFYALDALPSPTEADFLIDEIASHCHSYPLRIAEFNISNIPAEDPQAQTILNSIYHNASLLGAEEWIHNLQDAKGKLLTDAPDREIDVAVYLVKSGITLTDQFMSRYGRRQYLDSSTPTPPNLLNQTS